MILITAKSANGTKLFEGAQENTMLTFGPLKTVLVLQTMTDAIILLSSDRSRIFYTTLFHLG